MSLMVYGGGRRRVSTSRSGGVGMCARWVDAPVSRLSNRTTKCPRPARLWHSSSGQAIICVAQPITSTIAGSPAWPNVS